MSGTDRDLVFSALGDSCRRALLDRLRQQNGQTLSALAEGQGMSRQAVTKHLAVLERAGLVFAQRAGRERRHYLNPVPISAVAIRWLDPFGKLPLDVLGEAARRERSARSRRRRTQGAGFTAQLTDTSTS